MVVWMQNFHTLLKANVPALQTTVIHMFYYNFIIINLIIIILIIITTLINVENEIIFLI